MSALCESSAARRSVRHALVTVLCLAVVAPLCAASSAAAAEKVWVELATPSDEIAIQGPVGLVEIKGWTGTGLPGGHDVLIAIDRSASVWAASGADIDEDGKIGRNRSNLDLFLDFDRRSTDPGDTVLRAELMAARRLIMRLDPTTTRMGLMSFGGGARIHAPVGSGVPELLDALESIPAEPDFGGTSFDNALKLARLHFESLPPPADPKERRNRSLIMLSDGTPTAPAPVEHAERFAVLSARDASNIGVRIYAFALGPEALGNPVVYQEMTEVTGGELVLVESPGDVTDFVPHISLSRIARVEIDNLSSSESARAIRLFPDGSFDGFAPLREGLNLLRITVYGEDGYQRVVDRRVYFTKSNDGDESEKAQAAQILRTLKIRTQETELARNARKKLEDNQNARSTVTIEVEPAR